MKAILMVMVCALIVVACKDSQLPSKPGTPWPPPPAMTIRSGSSFGMCAGYCWTELAVAGTKATLIQKAWGRGGNSGLPDKKNDSTISATDWSAMAAAFDRTKFDALDTVLGCPDCADGGAEWLEIEQGTYKRRVTFEYGKPVPAIQDLLDKVRPLRESMKK